MSSVVDAYISNQPLQILRSPKQNRYVEVEHSTGLAGKQFVLFKIYVLCVKSIHNAHKQLNEKVYSRRYTTSYLAIIMRVNIKNVEITRKPKQLNHQLKIIMGVSNFLCA